MDSEKRKGNISKQQTSTRITVGQQQAYKYINYKLVTRLAQHETTPAQVKNKSHGHARMYRLLDLGDRLARVEPLGTHGGTAQDLATTQC
eukprot:360958-Chlamydomonas_euryale.AAC.7